MCPGHGCWHNQNVDAGVDHPSRELAQLRARVRWLEDELASLRGSSDQPLKPARISIQTPDGGSELRSGHQPDALHSVEAGYLLRMVQSLAGVSIWRWDVSSGVCECSDTLRELFGLTPGDSARLEDLFQRFHPEDRSKIRFDGRGQRNADSMEPAEFRVIRPDGSMRHIISTVAPLSEAGREDSPVWLGIVVDVTERYALEEELKDAQKMEALGRLAGGVAHDFNNYLTVALGNAEMLRAGIHQDSSRSLLDEIIAASERCQALTRRLLEFGRKRLVKAPVISVLDVVAQSRAILRRMLPQSMSLEVQVPGQDVRVRIDAGKLEQAIMNLVLNARDAMGGEGGITLKVRVKAELPAGKLVCANEGGVDRGCHSWVCIGIRDQGAGMDEETRSRVFEPFFTTKPAGRGTGLGLSIVYGIVAQAGGCMHVLSEAGQGSVFEIWLPQVLAPSAG